MSRQNGDKKQALFLEIQAFEEALQGGQGLTLQGRFFYLDKFTALRQAAIKLPHKKDAEVSMRWINDVERLVIPDLQRIGRTVADKYIIELAMLLADREDCLRLGISSQSPQISFFKDRVATLTGLIFEEESKVIRSKARGVMSSLFGSKLKQPSSHDTFLALEEEKIMQKTVSSAKIR